MTPQIDKTYRTERLTKREMQRLSGKYGRLSLSKKSTWVSFGLIASIMFIIVFVVPFVPPRYGWSDWSPPTSIDEYQSRVSSFLIVVPLILSMGLAYLSIRNTIDLKSGIKRTANFKV